MMLPRREFLIPSLGFALVTPCFSWEKQRGHKSDLADQRKFTAANVDENLRLKGICVQADQDERNRIRRENARSLNLIPGLRVEAKPRPLRFIEFVDVNGKVLEKIRLKTKGSPVQPKPGERFIELPDATASRYLFELTLRFAYFYTSCFIGSWKGQAATQVPIEIGPGRVEIPSFPEEERPQVLLALAAFVAEWRNLSDLEAMNTAIKQQVSSNKAISEMLKSSKMRDRNNDTLQIQLQYDSTKNPELSDTSLVYNEYVQAGMTSLIGVFLNWYGKTVVEGDANDFIRDWKERPVFESKKDN